MNTAPPVTSARPAAHHRGSCAPPRPRRPPHQGVWAAPPGRRGAGAPVPSRDVAVGLAEGVREAVLVEALHDLGDPVRHAAGDLIPEHPVDLGEVDLVVARVLLALDEADLAALGLLADLLDEIQLAVVLARVADVEPLARDLFGGRLQDGPDAARGVADVHVGAP